MFVVRLLAGLVFFAEGIKRFMFPTELGNRPIRQDPHLSAPSVGVVETVCIRDSQVTRVLQVLSQGCKD